MNRIKLLYFISALGFLLFGAWSVLALFSGYRLLQLIALFGLSFLLYCVILERDWIKKAEL